ncbi:MAG: hypothetical protein LPJ92_15645 [Rhodobacterales bacterium]|nr:hypothetical protein [Rhodobacterales bacterium]MDX5391766.1 hypothetical protein [Rhodobacterales bacterium]MDX5491466.1 hypothetical protein [Rhodobacterales bacterium]
MKGVPVFPLLLDEQQNEGDQNVAGSTALRGLVITLIAIQLFDVAIHVGTDQVEPVRILSNAVVGLWAVWCLFSRAAAKAGIAAILVYLGLNGWFLAMHGLRNPDQGDALRITLFVLVGASTAIALWLRARRAAA